ncbi:MAG TPA: hypothetical protein VFQ77_09855 [Pseudonocardiaceae bacterium]|nr:hypothetical protein [Pseudonocardiaceae bacterium]
MSPEIIGAIFTGLTGLIAALAAYAANRGRRTAADLHALRRRVRRLERLSAAAVGHVFQLELVLSGHGFSVPPRPQVLEEFYADSEKGEKGDVASGVEEPSHDRS